MTRCPNCGSTVRAGAKFCTTCGFRLPAPPADTPEPASSRSPFDITSSSSVAARWPSGEAPTADDAAPSADHESPPTEAAADVVPETAAGEAIAEPAEAPAEAGGASFTGWPAYGNGPGSGWDSAPANGNQEAPIQEAEPTKLERTVDDAAESWSSDPPIAVGPAQEASDAEAEPAAEAQTPREDPNDLSAYSWLSIEARKRDETVPGAEAAPANAESAAGTATDSQESSVASQEADSSSGTAAAAPIIATQERAIQLLDELRGLIPSLTGETGADEGASGDLATELATLLEIRDADAERFQSLRAAVATAQARPRDVDIMLDLVARADVMAAMIAAHDRYASGIESAVAKLRGEPQADAEPRW